MFQRPTRPFASIAAALSLLALASGCTEPEGSEGKKGPSPETTSCLGEGEQRVCVNWSCDRSSAKSEFGKVLLCTATQPLRLPLRLGTYQCPPTGGGIYCPPVDVGGNGPDCTATPDALACKMPMNDPAPSGTGGSSGQGTGGVGGSEETSGTGGSAGGSGGVGGDGVDGPGEASGTGGSAGGTGGSAGGTGGSAGGTGGSAGGTGGSAGGDCCDVPPNEGNGTGGSAGGTGAGGSDETSGSGGSAGSDGSGGSGGGEDLEPCV